MALRNKGYTSLCSPCRQIGEPAGCVTATSNRSKFYMDPNTVETRRERQERFVFHCINLSFKSYHIEATKHE